MYLNLWKQENITSGPRDQKYLRYAKLQPSSGNWSKNGKKIPKNSHFSKFCSKNDIYIWLLVHSSYLPHFPNPMVAILRTKVAPSLNGIAKL